MGSGGALNASPCPPLSHPRRGACWSLPASATNVSALSPGISQPPRAGQVQSSCSRVEKLSQNGTMPGAGCGGKVGCRKPSRPSLQEEVKEAEASPPACPRTLQGVAWRDWEWWGGGTVPGDTGPAVLQGRGKWGPSRGRGRTAPVRRRTPPACWVSGRPHRWLVSAPPRSSCPRPSSSFGTA